MLIDISFLVFILMDFMLHLLLFFVYLWRL